MFELEVNSRDVEQRFDLSARLHFTLFVTYLISFQVYLH